MNQLNEALDSFFHLKERGTTVRTELVAGATSFMTLAFLIAVHPSIMASCGMDKGAMATVTIVSAMIFTLICGLYCNIPFVLATAMGSNALIAYSIVGAGITTWQVALGMNFISGVIFVIISVCNIREMVVKVIPKGLKITMGAAVGMFITATGMSNVKLIRLNDSGFLKLGDLHSPEIILTGITLLLILAFTSRKMKSGLLLAMVIGTVIGIPMGLTTVPSHLISMPPSMAPVAFKLDIPGALKLVYVPFILAFFMGDFFSTVGNLFGIGSKANLLDEEGNFPDIKKPFIVDAVGTCVGTVMGTNTVTIYAQSAAGVEAGGRTGLTAVGCAICLGLALFFTPVALMVPNSVSSAALITIGLGMLTCMEKLDYSDFTEYMPAFASVMGTAYTYNIATGLTLGIITCVITKLAAGKAKELHPAIYIIAVPLLYYLIALA